MTEAPPRGLTIAGSDSGGGAGIAADLKTFERHRVWGLVAVTAVTAQNTVGVDAWERVSPALVASQIEAVATDIGIDAAKTGMLGDADVIRAVADAVRRCSVTPLVVDPVFVSKHGDALLRPDAVAALREELIPLSTLITPNLAEASGLAGVGEIDDRAGMEAAAKRLLDLGAEAVLVKGGHLATGPAADVLVTVSGVEWLEAERLDRRHTHGTGCVLSASITARLALGDTTVEAVRAAKAFVTDAIRRGLPLGRGVGPVNPGA